MKILHISESFEGGVASAVANYVDLTPEHEHFLLCSTRSGRLDCGIVAKFSTVYDLTGGHFSAIKTVRSVVDKARPDVIHCHSSFGGAYARLAYSKRKCPALMVYSPHCYAFERRDISLPARKAYYSIERILARRTDVVAACSLREKGLAEKLGAKAVYVPNLPSVKSGASLPYAKRKNNVVMVGRLSPQKDPEWFAKVAERLGSSARCIWIGDGEDARYRERLEATGVEVTGWVAPDRVSKLLSEAKVYLHSAAWEGFPIALLDAEACGAAIVAREATYLEGVDGVEVDSVESASEQVSALLENEKKWEQNKKKWESAVRDNNNRLAAQRLKSVYLLDKKA